MNTGQIDRRAIGGQRVVAQFSLVTGKQSTFIQQVERLQGTLVFNARGGCLFIKNGVDANVITQISDTVIPGFLQN